MTTREATLGRIEHPDPLRVQGRVLTRVDDAGPIRQGDPTLGWAGDDRSQLYVDMRTGEWVLMRLEHDNVYRTTMSWPFGVARGHDIVPKAIMWLIAHDTQAGFSPYEWVVETDDARRARSDAAMAEQVGEAAEAVAWGLKRDGVS